MNIYSVLSILVLFVMLGYSGYVYSDLPQVMVTHFGIDGVPNGWMKKDFAVSFLPVLSVLLYLGLMYLPKIDPLARNYPSFRKQYDIFIFAFVLFLASIQMMLLNFGLGSRVPMERVVLPGLGILFLAIGNVLRHSERNWFVGIRTPWTMSSDVVWRGTHLFASRLFIGTGIFAIFSVGFPRIAIVGTVLLSILTSILSILYSYVLYQKNKPDSTHATE